MEADSETHGPILGPTKGILLRRGRRDLYMLGGVRDIAEKPTETTSPAHGNSESEPTTREPAWDQPKPFAYM